MHCFRTPVAIGNLAADLFQHFRRTAGMQIVLQVLQSDSNQAVEIRPAGIVMKNAVPDSFRDLRQIRRQRIAVARLPRPATVRRRLEQGVEPFSEGS